MVKPSRKLAVTGAHYGARDWLVQRVTAVFMLIYIFVLAWVICVQVPQDYMAWKIIFQHQWLRIASFIFFLCLFWHAWIGMRNILMDYVHLLGIRLTVQIAVIASLLFYAVWAAEILWS